jgi:hypothetical protein
MQSKKYTQKTLSNSSNSLYNNIQTADPHYYKHLIVSMQSKKIYHNPPIVSGCMMIKAKRKTSIASPVYKAAQKHPFYIK